MLSTEYPYTLPNADCCRSANAIRRSIRVRNKSNTIVEPIKPSSSPTVQKNEVRILFGDIFKLSLRAVQKAFSGQATRPDGNLRLIYVIARSRQVLFHTQHNLDTNLLVRFQYFIEEIVAGIENLSSLWQTIR